MRVLKPANLLLLLIMTAIILLGAPVWAGGGDDVELNSELVGGDVSVGGDSSKAIGFGRSSFDVDINQCLASTSWDTIIVGKQKLVLNWVCMAEFYLKNGKPELAAMAVCNTEVLDEFSSEAECEAAHDFFEEVVETSAVMGDSYWEEEDEEYREERMQNYDERIAQLEQRASQPQVTREVTKERYLSSKQRAALEEVLKE